MRVYVVENKSYKDRFKDFEDLIKVFSDAQKAEEWIKEVGPQGNWMGPITANQMIDARPGTRLCDYVGEDKIEVFVTEVIE